MPEFLGTMWFSRTFESRHSQTETELRPAPIVPFRYIQNICGGVQRTSWRRLVCRKINHSVRPVPSSAPVLAPCLWETQTPFIQISPCTAQSWLSQLYCVSVPAFKGNNYSCILPSERMHSQELCGAIELCLYGLLLCSSVIHELPQSLTCLESISVNINEWQFLDRGTEKKSCLDFMSMTVKQVPLHAAYPNLGTDKYFTSPVIYYMSQLSGSLFSMWGSCKATQEHYSSAQLYFFS